ncbi:hypothetical protein BP5796_02413 [Coleophoma crateriformis]|uniref:DNA replication factor Cdt1 C-terminal domain-containing protein n=1 Tax=Coleophoma crateriformis TaxID=565419 RepID=A0A3D8SZR1_9HELO|nr:hypothetical protein BP5796_02413 [Coleophoma crateriformis]
MSAAIKRRKVSASSSASALARPRGLDAFTRISKATTPSKSVLDKNNYVDSSIVTRVEEAASPGRKRKLVTLEEENLDEEISMKVDPSRDVKPLPRKRTTTAATTRTPQTPQKPIVEDVSTTETPTKGARGLLDRLVLANTTPTRSPLRADAGSTAILDNSTTAHDLPHELLDLINLHAAFLTALTLHYAHNGTNSPADLRLLCPDVARAWGKRRVTVDDIRKSLGVMNSNYHTAGKGLSRLALSDYGHGKICIEINTTGPSRLARPLNENVMNHIFIQGLRDLWESQDSGDVQVTEFIQNLPAEAITTCSSVSKISPLLAKGQRRLEDMKAGIIFKKEAVKEKVSDEATVVTGKRPTLLERLRAKQLERSNMPPSATKEELQRKAALQRLEEVVAILTILSTSSSVGQQRVSFTLPTVMSKLRDSFKTPMSKDEADVALRLLASEIAPKWVKVVKMGKMEAMVVDREEKPDELALKESIVRASSCGA